MNSQPPLPNNEIARLNALRQYQILDTPPENAFNDFTFLAAQICGTPIALISLIDGNRQWFKSKVGLTVTETSRDVAFCAYAIVQQDLLVVRNALTDSRFATNPLVTSDPNIRFYAGAPLVTSEGHAIGTLCIIDTVPRDLSPEQAEALRALSRQVMMQLELRRNVITISRSITKQQHAAQQLSRQQDLIEAFYRQGVDKARGGDYLGAIADFDQFLRLNPKGVKAYYNRGLARRQLRDYLGAIEDFNKFLRLNPNDADAHLNRGLARSEIGDYLGAMADYNYAMRINPDYAVVDYDQLAHSELRDDQEVIADYTAEADISQGNAHSELEDYSGAIADYSQSLPLNSNDAKDYISQGNAQFELKDYSGALEAYTQAVWRMNLQTEKND